MATPYLDGPLYELECPAGHKAVVQLNNPKHEILFQMAAYSLYDGNYRDAVVTFTSSLEEFWDFALQCFFAGQGVEPLPVPRAKWPRKRFERQWKRKLKSVPPVLPEEDCELRNRVVHEGLIPTKDEAFGHGDKVLLLIAPAMQKLRWDLLDAVGKASAAIIAEGKARLGLGEPTAAIQDAMILHDNESMSYRRLVDYMSHLQKLDALFASLSRENATEAYFTGRASLSSDVRP
jgi:hypothetical protein